jgi:hypothetical protein
MIAMLRTPILRLALGLAAVAAMPAAVFGQSDAPAQIDARGASVAVSRGISSSFEQSFLGGEPPMLARDLQGQLKRLGCLSGEVDGVWGEGSKKALKDFARHAKLSIANDEPTPAVLDVATAMKERACPLVCGDDQRAVNGRCVAKEQRKPARREAEAAGEGRRQRAERPSRAERSGGESSPPSSGGGLKLCSVGGRQMAVCN